MAAFLRMIWSDVFIRIIFLNLIKGMFDSYTIEKVKAITLCALKGVLFYEKVFSISFNHLFIIFRM